jgi:succinate dehydrogenase/fumarate reductase flavoprotein subunit
MGRESTRSVSFNLHLPGNLSADGKAMAVRAGLKIMNMEFLGARRYGLANYETAGRPPRNTWQPAASVVNANGEVVVPKTSFYDWGDLEKGYKIDAAETRRQWIASGATTPQGMPSRRQLEEAGPFYVDCTGGTEEEIRYVEWALSNEVKCRQLLKHLKEEGIDLRRDKLELGLGSRELGNLAAAGLVVDNNLETEMNGLYAAGDEIGGVPFGAASGALVTGWRTGDRAAKYAKKQGGFLPVSNENPQSLRERCSDMINTKGGCRWREVEETLQNIMDIYCPDVKTEAMMKRGLECLHDTRDIPIRAADAHELSRGLEVRSLLDNAEMTLRTALARKETRKLPCNFYRADFPDQDDKNWFVFSSIKLENNEFKVSKIPIK